MSNVHPKYIKTPVLINIHLMNHMLSLALFLYIVTHPRRVFFVNLLRLYYEKKTFFQLYLKI